MRVYLDDLREAPAGWRRVYWPDEAIALLETGDVKEISLDHDLGDDAKGTGYDVILWIEEAVAIKGFIPPIMRVHSSNASAREKMERGILAIERLAKSKKPSLGWSEGEIETKNSRVKQLLWITDAHLDHLTGATLDLWFERVADSGADILLLGGDSSNSRMFSRMLSRVQSVFAGKVALVAGNHDYYHSSIQEIRTELAALQRSGMYVFEPGCQREPILLKEGVYLCGSGGWGDASAGCADAMAMPLNDERMIAELKTGNLNHKLRELGQESANHLKEQLASLPDDASNLIVLTHVPPWPQAAWHEGRPSDTWALPRFCWQAGGLVISEAAVRMPQTQFTILCGHTHSDGIWQQGNITCHTASSVYGVPNLSGTILIGDKVSVMQVTT